MKTRILLLLAVALPGIHGVCRAQSPVQEVIDNAMIQQSMTNTQDLLGVLQQQLSEAQKQTQSLTDQLTRMGNPAAVTLPALDLMKQDIALSQANATNGANREERIRNTTGTEAFGDNSFGLMEGINQSITLKDGSTAERDPEKYKLYAALMEDLNQLDEKSKQTDERIAQLEQQRPALLEQVSNAKDQATIMKYQVALQTIDAQIASSKADLAKSKQDYDVLMEKLKLQTQINSKGNGEKNKLEADHRKALQDAARAAGSSGSGGSGSSSSGTTPQLTTGAGNLKWGDRATRESRRNGDSGTGEEEN